MKNKPYTILKSLTVASMCVTNLAIAQVQTLPYFHNFGTASFTNIPTGFSTGTPSLSPVSSQSVAQNAIVIGTANIIPSTSTQTAGGSYGYATANNGRYYIQNSSSATVGTNQLILTINTLGWHGVQLNYDIEMINVNSRTAGVVLQYRIGTSGSWSNVLGGVYAHNSLDRVNGQIDNFVNLVLPTIADNKPIVQLRWSTWRGTQTGAHSGTAIDNVGVSAKYAGTNTLFSISNASGCNQLFISEYIHDATVNRAIEIYNPTTTKLDLTGYYLTITSGTNVATYIPLNGVIDSHKTWVVANKEASLPILAKANQLVTNLNYSGNDIIGLVYSTNPLASVTIIDKIGDIYTPVSSGWPVSVGANIGSTQNKTLTRLMNKSGGNVEWSTTQHEWFTHPVNTYSFLGWHNSVCSPADMPLVYFHTGSETDNILGSTNTSDPNPILIDALGTWSNDFNVYFDDTYHYNYYGASTSLVISPAYPINCSTPSAPMSDYTIPVSPANFVIFPVSAGGGGPAVSAMITFDINSLFLNSYMQANSYSHTYVCFGLEDDFYNQGMFTFGNTLTDEVLIQGGAVGIQEFIDNKQIQIFPNPVTNNLTISNKSKLAITVITITDVLGQEVMSVKPEVSETTNINTIQFVAGVYFVKIVSNSDNFTLKIIKH
jgi:hypothetical protein